MLRLSDSFPLLMGSLFTYCLGLFQSFSHFQFAHFCSALTSDLGPHTFLLLYRVGMAPGQWALQCNHSFIASVVLLCAAQCCTYQLCVEALFNVFWGRMVLLGVCYCLQGLSGFCCMAFLYHCHAHSHSSCIVVLLYSW